MARQISHRGPDASGFWCDPAARIAFGHRRLSILDVSPAGAQPMFSASGRYVLVFNGEIYNHLELRKLLLGPWRGRSDTETLLAAIERWGLSQALRRSVGMFALALWDREARVLSLARDRFGEKPLYYGWNEGSFLFGSELKALRAFPEFRTELDHDALRLFFFHGSVPAPWSAFAGIYKLKPGHMLQLALDGAPGSEQLSSYWDLRDALGAPFPGSPHDACDELERRLTEAVRYQMISDVPLGAFLSGGIDSSLIVSLMQEASSAPVRTFNIGFEEAAFDETKPAADIARCLGTDHTSLTVTASDALAWIPRLPEIWDEPFADPSQLPTAILALLTRRSVTVSLSGDGGDELFCGYEHYMAGDAIDRLPGKAVASGVLDILPPPLVTRILQSLPFAFAKRIRTQHVSVLRGILHQKDSLTRYLSQVYQPETPAKLLQGGLHYPLNTEAVPDGMDFYTMASFHDILAYLPNDILVKIDRASMAAGLEARVPFLDHRVAELAMSLPSSIKVRDGKLKWPLREVAFRHIPKELLDRPKMGFSIPIGQWLSGPLRPWAEGLLLESGSDDLVSQAEISSLWRRHCAGDADHSSQIWKVLMYRGWRLSLNL